jgi:uncharacterized protein (DUF1778 family)
MYYLNMYDIKGANMPRVAIDHNNRMSIRIHPDDKTTILRAAALTHTDLTEFVIQHALTAARLVIEDAEHVKLSERDSLRVLELLENPPNPNPKLEAAARDLPEDHFL